MKPNGSFERESLMQQGWDYLESGAYIEAEEVADQLIAAGESSGYRLRAMCQVADDEWEDALESLASGIEHFPEDWELHLMQGNFYSENEEYDKALASFERALGCPDVQPQWIQLNQAVIHSKMGEFEQCLNICQAIQDPELRLQVLEVEFRVLAEMGHTDLILNQAEARLANLPEVEDEGSGAIMSKIMYFIAVASWDQEQSEEEILKYLWGSIDFDRTNPHALWLLREIRQESTEAASLFKLLVQGHFRVDMGEDEGEGPTPFFTSYEVVADSIEEAFEMVREYEVEDVDPDSLQVLQYESVGFEEEGYKGIYEVGVFASLGM